jgi:hypothetical protein
MRVVDANGVRPVTCRAPRPPRAVPGDEPLNKPDGEAVALEGLGNCHLAAGQPQVGAGYLNQAAEVYQCLGVTLDTERVRARLSSGA